MFNLFRRCYTFFVFPANNLEKYFTQLNEQNWTLIPVDKNVALKLQNSAKTKFEARHFKAAGISGAELQVASIRNDSTFWLDADSQSLTEADKNVMTGLHELTGLLKNYFRISLTELECHYAVYEPGQFYKIHRDSTQNDNKRVFSFVLYLNQDWDPADGGQLVGYENQNKLFSILPEIGNMVLFKSDIEHEVLPSYRMRYSLTGWFRR